MQTPLATNKTRLIPRTPAENTAPTIGHGMHPTGSTRRDTVHRTPRSSPQNTLPQHSHARGPHANTATARSGPSQPAKRGKFGRRKGPDPRPGPGAHALGRLPWLAGFPARERRLRPRRLIVAPQIDCAPERHTTGRKCISRRRRPLCAATTASRPMRPAHFRPAAWKACQTASHSALVPLRLLFSVAPKGPRLPAPPTPGRLPPRREESWCAGERQKARHIRAFHGKKGIGGPLTDKNAGRSRTRIWRAKAPTAICRLESSSGNPRIRNASTPETLASTTSKTTPRCLTFKQSSPPLRFSSPIFPSISSRRAAEEETDS